MKTIVFDVDDTLYDQQQPFLNAVNQVFPAILETDISKLYIYFRFHSDDTFLKVVSKEWSIDYMRCHRIREALKDLNGSIPTDSKCTLFQETYEKELNQMTMHPEITKIFDYLKEAKVPMGIITNGPTDHQYRKIKQLRLEKWIPNNNIIISQTIGYQKPEKEIFQIAAKQFQMKPSETIYIGDSFENDVVGAHNSGWQAIWFNHRMRKMPTDLQATYLLEVRSFEDLFESIKQFVV